MVHRLCWVAVNQPRKGKERKHKINLHSLARAQDLSMKSNKDKNSCLKKGIKERTMLRIKLGLILLLTWRVRVRVMKFQHQLNVF